ncbi:MAG: hypothetical protein ACYCV7_08810 [Acidimicrobiales bacterium]
MLTTVATLAAFVFAFVFLPWLVLPRPKSAKNRLDAVVINFIRWTAIVVTGVQLLAVGRLYEMTTIVVGCLVGIWITKLRPRGWRLAAAGEILHQGALHVARAVDRRERRSVTSRGGVTSADGIAAPGDESDPAPWEHRSARHRRVPWPRRVAHLVPAALLAVPVLVVLGIAAFLRFQLPLKHQALSPGDAYVHMTWALQLDLNQLFPNGIYPMGLASVLSFVGKFSIGVPMPDVVRVMGPLIGTLIVLGIFYTVLRLSRSTGAALFAAATFGLFGTRAEWHEPWTRQTGALPQELSLALALLTLGIVGLAVVSRDRDHLWTIFAGALAMGMTHPLPLVLFGLLTLVLALVVGVATGHARFAVRTVIVAAAGSVAGNLYMPLALAAGVPFYAGVTNINPLASHQAHFSSLTAQYGKAVGLNLMSEWAIIAAAIGFIGGVLMTLRKSMRTRGATLMGLSAVSGVILAAYDPLWLGLNNFYATRAANIAGPQIALAFGAGLGALSLLFRRINLRTAAITLAAGLVMIDVFSHFFPPVPRTFTPIEYDSVAANTQRIIGAYTPLTYTIVGTPEQQQRSTSHAYFVDLWVFARDIRLADAENAAYQIPIPTNNIFITVEKHPFPVHLLPQNSPTAEYYQNPVKRGRMMAIVYQWCQTYLRYHTNMTIYYNGPNVRIYQIRQVADIGAAKHSPQFKNYTWHPGVLFNSGPTAPLKMVIP